VLGGSPDPPIGKGNFVGRILAHALWPFRFHTQRLACLTQVQKGLGSYRSLYFQLYSLGGRNDVASGYQSTIAACLLGFIKLY